MTFIRCPGERSPELPFDQPERCDSPNSGGSGIRTHGALTDTTVFETARFGHSRIPPGARLAEDVAAVGEEVPQQGAGAFSAHTADDFDLVVEAGVRAQIEK